MGFSRQGYESGLPFPSLGELLDSGEIEPGSPALQADFFFFAICATREALLPLKISFYTFSKKGGKKKSSSLGRGAVLVFQK